MLVLPLWARVAVPHVHAHDRLHEADRVSNAPAGETCPLSTGRRTRRVQLVQGEGGGAGGRVSNAPAGWTETCLLRESARARSSRAGRSCTSSKSGATRLAGRVAGLSSASSLRFGVIRYLSAQLAGSSAQLERHAEWGSIDPEAGLHDAACRRRVGQGGGGQNEALTSTAARSRKTRHLPAPGSARSC